jgi:hypothetical protein
MLLLEVPFILSSAELAPVYLAKKSSKRLLSRKPFRLKRAIKFYLLTQRPHEHDRSPWILGIRGESRGENVRQYFFARIARKNSKTGPGLDL